MVFWRASVIIERAVVVLNSTAQCYFVGWRCTVSCSRSMCCLMWNITRNLCRLLHDHLLIPAMPWTTKEAALRGHGNVKCTSYCDLNIRSQTRHTGATVADSPPQKGGRRAGSYGTRDCTT